MSNTRSRSKAKNTKGPDTHQVPRESKSSSDTSSTEMTTDINEEPVSLAEEIVVEIDQHGKQSGYNNAQPIKDDILIAQLHRMSAVELLEQAKNRNIPDAYLHVLDQLKNKNN